MMNLDRNIWRKGILLVSLTTYTFASFSQQQQQQQNQTEDVRKTTNAIDSIDVVRDYRPILADAVKIRRSPDMSNKREYQPKLSYQIIDKKLDITTGTKQLSIQTMPIVNRLQEKENYAKIGAGNFSTFLGEVYIANSQFEDTRFGGYFKHFNQLGKQVDQNYSEQAVGVFGRQIQDAFTLSGNLDYNRNAVRYFGFHLIPEDIQLAGLNGTEAGKQKYNDISLNAEIASNTQLGVENPLHYSVKANGYLFSDAFDAKENSFGLSAYLKKEINEFHIGAELEGDFASNSYKNNRISNNIVSIRPFVQFQGEHYKIHLGANVISESGDSSRFNVFPVASVDFALAPEYFHVFGGITGQVKRNSFRELSRENPFLSSASQFRNSFERMNIYGGIKGNAGATFGYKAKVYYSQIENMPLFVSSDNPVHQYEVFYENSGKNTSIFGVEGEILVRISEVVNLGGKLNIQEYTLPTQEHAWYLPKVKIGANARFNISDRLYIDGELNFQGERFGRQAKLMPPQLGQGNTFLPAQVEWNSVSLPSFVDLSAGASFKLTDQFSLFGRINNILNNKYERYLYYPAIGMNVFGGLTFSF